MQGIDGPTPQDIYNNDHYNSEAIGMNKREINKITNDSPHKFNG